MRGSTFNRVREALLIFTVAGSLRLAWCVSGLFKKDVWVSIKLPDLCRLSPPVWGRAGLRAGTGSILGSSLTGLEPHWLPSRSEPGARWELPCVRNVLLKEKGGMFKFSSSFMASTSSGGILVCVQVSHLHLTFFCTLLFPFSSLDHLMDRLVSTTKYSDMSSSYES